MAWNYLNENISDQKHKKYFKLENKRNFSENKMFKYLLGVLILSNIGKIGQYYSKMC